MELCSAVEPILVLASAKALHTTEIKQGDWSASWVEHEGWQLQLVCVPAEGGGHVVAKEWPLDQHEAPPHCCQPRIH
jgi:hypothetical protein